MEKVYGTALWNRILLESTPTWGTTGSGDAWGDEFFSWFIQRKGVFEITYQLKGADDTGVVQRVKK